MRAASAARRRATWRRTTLSKSSTLARTFTVADAHALADRLERNQRPQSEQAMAAKLIRALLAGRAAGRLVSIAPLLNTSSALFLLGEGGREALRRAVTCKETPPACHLGGTFF